MEPEKSYREFEQFAQSWIQQNGKSGMRRSRDDTKSPISDVKPRPDTIPNQDYNRFSKEQMQIDDTNSPVPEVKPQLDTMPMQNCNWFSKEQMYMMDHHPFEKGCPVQLLDMTVEDVFQSPLIRQTYHLLDALTKKEIILTSDGYLPVSIVEELYEMGTHSTPRLNIRDFAEYEITEVHLLHTVLKETSLIREDSGKMFLTDKGKTALTDQNVLVRTIITYLFKDFDISSLDLQQDSECGNSGCLYSLWLLHHFGSQWHGLKFYEKEYFNAYTTKKGGSKRNTRGFITINSIYSQRIFMGLFLNLGLTEKFFKFGDPGIKKSILLEKMFSFEDPIENMFK